MNLTHPQYQVTYRLRYTLFKIFLCFFVAGFTLFAYIEKQNELAELRMAIPAIEKEWKEIEQENIRLLYQIEQFNSPVHLMKLSQHPEFSHLHPSNL